MKNYICLFLIIGIVHYTNAQGLTKSGEITTNVALYVSTNGAIGASTFVNKNGQVATAIVPLAVGDSYQGGIIFYFFVSGNPGYVTGEIHGLIAATSDIGVTRKFWGLYGRNVTGTQSGIGYGAQNTQAITAVETGLDMAAILCSDLVLNSYSDWYLPSFDELTKVYENKSLIGVFKSAIYWSSTQSDSNFVQGRWFDNGMTGSYSKNNNYWVRPIRSF